MLVAEGEVLRTKLVAVAQDFKPLWPGRLGMLCGQLRFHCCWAEALPVARKLPLVLVFRRRRARGCRKGIFVAVCRCRATTVAI